jgi:putative Holliday junction resolvase
MGVILALDVGGKRTGIAISDDSETFAFPLHTVETRVLIPELKKLQIERGWTEIVMGMPVNLKNEATDGTKIAIQVKASINKFFPDIHVFTVDERFTSSMAKKSLLDGGMKKSDRRQKENTDKVSATLILQSYLEQKLRFGLPTGTNTNTNGI